MRKIKLILLLLITLLLTGCWDLVEINQRIYPYSFGVDIAEDKAQNEDLSLTITYPNIKALGKNPSQEEKTYVLNAKGNGLFHTARKVSTEIQGPLYFKHLRVIVFGEEVAKDPKLVKEIMDGLMRDFIINKRVNISIVKGTAEELLKTLPKNVKQESLEGTLFSLLLNIQKSTYFTPEHLSDFINSMDKKGASVVPLLHLEDGDIKAHGGGVFKDYKLVGYISGEENTALAILNNQVETEVLSAEYKGDRISLNTINIQSKKKLINDEEAIKIKYTILIEGTIQEYTINDQGSEVKDMSKLHEIENIIENNIKERLESIIQVLQKDLNADALQIGEYLSKYHPKLWTTLKDDWDDSFPDIEIELDVAVKIRRRGLIH